MHLSRKLSATITHYTTMYAYDNHFRVDDERGTSHVSFDSGVATIITQECRSSRVDQSPIHASLQYVGVIKDIFRVDYRHIFFNVFRCSWIKPNMDGNATIREDEHGFWSIKFNARQPAGLESYIFPCDVSQIWNMWQNTEETLVNVSDLYSTTRSFVFLLIHMLILKELLQVYFVDDDNDPEWKVVVYKECRSRRIVYTSCSEGLSVAGRVDVTRNVNGSSSLHRRDEAAATILATDVEHINAYVERDDEAGHVDINLLEDEDDEGDVNAAEENVDSREPITKSDALDDF